MLIEGSPSVRIVVVSKVEEEKTRITINTRFQVVAYVNSGVGKGPRKNWSWTTNNRATQYMLDNKGGKQARIMQSNGKIEKRIFATIEKLFMNSGL